MAARIPGAGVDRITGRPIAGWPHVEHSLDCIFSTPFGSRPLRRWFGSWVPEILGRENVEPRAILKLFTAIYAALVLEPRFALTRVRVVSNADELRTGKLRLELEGFYRPRGHLGDYTAEGARRVVVSFFNESVGA